MAPATLAICKHTTKIVEGEIKISVSYSVVDPDPVGSETFRRIRYGDTKIIPDPDPGSSGSEMNLKLNYSKKLIKYDNFSTKILNS